MIPAVLLLVIGYALSYTGASGISDGVLTGGNKQGLLASLGVSPNGLSSQVAFSPSALLTNKTSDLNNAPSPSGSGNNAPAPATAAVNSGGTISA